MRFPQQLEGEPAMRTWSGGKGSGSGHGGKSGGHGGGRGWPGKGQGGKGQGGKNNSMMPKNNFRPQAAAVEFLGGGKGQGHFFDKF